MSKRVETWELRARFAAALSRMYGAEVPAYTTLVEVSAEVNRELGASERVTAERHGAIRVGSPRELADVADLFAAFGMYPVGFYDLRDAASPVPVVSTAFRPIEEDQLARNPFRVFTSMLATADPRFFPTELRGRVERFVAKRQLFDPALIAEARRIADDAGADPDRAERFVAAAVAAFALSREPIDRGWYEELSRVSAVAADIAGVATTHINHLTPRVLDIDELYRRMTARGITMIDAIQGPPRWHGPDVLLRQTSFRALAEPRRFRDDDGTVSDGALRVRFGEVEARGVALTPKGRKRYDAAMATPRPGNGVGRLLSLHRRGHGVLRTGLLPRRGSVETGCLRGLPAGIGGRYLPVESRYRHAGGRTGRQFGLQRRLDGRSDRAPHSRSVRALRESRIIMTTVQTSQLPTAEDLRTQVRDALQAIGSRADLGEPGGQGVQASTPITGDVLFTVAETTAPQADEAIAEAAQAFTTWRTTPAPVRGALVARLGQLLVEHKADLATLVTVEAGKITSEALGEVQEMIDICEFAVGLSRQLYGKTIASERPGHRLMETWHPLGVVGVITAFNFPVAVWSWNTAIALVCGDTVVWKPSELTPLTALACQALIERAASDVGASVHIARLIQGGREVGERLVDDPRVALLSATGSVRMGQQVGPRVAQRFGKALLELGGNNAAIVTPSADLDLAVRGIVFSAAGTAGQRCTTLRRLIVHSSVADELVKRIVSAYRQLPVGDPAADGTLVGPLIHETAYREMVGALEKARADGGEVSGGDRREVGDESAYYVAPAVVRMPAQTEVVHSETFAPILYVLTYEELDEAIALNNEVPQGLSSAIFTLDVREAERFMAADGSDCGIANVNIGTSGAEIGGAFGGEKQTGGGRESGSDAWKAYMRRATNTVNYSSELPLAQGVHFG